VPCDEVFERAFNRSPFFGAQVAKELGIILVGKGGEDRD
jgi:hypothetical protein